MVGFLIKRPIAVFMAFIVAMLLGAFLFTKIPVSLLPNIDVPHIIVQVNYPNNSAEALEEKVVRKIRESLVTLSKLDNIESQTTNHSATIHLKFDYGTKMDLAYIAVNEKLDQLSNLLPTDLPRPKVARVNTSDIPIVRLQVIPKLPEDYAEVSVLTEKVIKKRIEQIPGVSIVDINGLQFMALVLEPNLAALAAVGLSWQDVANNIQQNNITLGALSVKDGNYRFQIKLANELVQSDQIASINIRLKNGALAKLGDFVKISNEVIEPQGYHLLNGKEGLVITVQKQERARMNDLAPAIDEAIQVFKKDYPQIDFELTQNQNFLLEQGIQNLTQDLWYGGVFCILLLFLFLGNYGAPFLMAISIPVSLLLTFIFFYVFNISFNIISLSGLALGIGMLIDNSIIVIDSITQKRKSGFSMEDSCIVGVRDVMSPVISNVLTTVAIYAPLIYLSGLAGALVFDQAIALTISLAVSLLVAFCLNPVLYKYIIKTSPEQLRDHTKAFTVVSSAYHKMIDYIFKRKRFFFLATLLIMPIGFILMQFIPVSTLPKILETETRVQIDWNEPITVQENNNRIKALGASLNQKTLSWEADVGLKQFVNQWSDNASTQSGDIYFKFASQADKNALDKQISKWLQSNYPLSKFTVTATPNAFTQLFENNKPFLEARFRTNNTAKPITQSDVAAMMSQAKVPYNQGLSLNTEVGVEFSIDNAKMALYGVDMNILIAELERLFGAYKITEMKRFGDVQRIYFREEQSNLEQKLQSQISANNGANYSLNRFIKESKTVHPKFILADKYGPYTNVNMLETDVDDIDQVQTQLVKSASSMQHTVNFTGNYLDNIRLKWDMLVIFIISISLLYFILAVQFEHLIQPFLVMLTIPLGIAGATLCLWLAGGTLNIMAGIGYIVVLGIIVDDPSLKVETINRLRAEYAASGMTNKNEILMKALRDAGDICLKPLLLVSLTTSLALLPVLFTSGIGNDLQKPMVYVVVGGLTIGTFFTLWFIPLAYWFITKKEK